ncbi:MAG: hypothetical protein ABIJ45_05805 [Candidatus Zixiibacteriota bacterium]
MSPKSHGKKTQGHFYNSEFIGYALFLIGVALFLYQTLNFNFTQDDAFITFRYAENFINGHGLVFNIGERIEGYTNFLWTIIIILGRLAGLDPISFSRILGIFFGVGTIGLTFLLSRLIFSKNSIWSGGVCLMLGAAQSFAYWAGAGLETAAFGFFIILSFYLYLKKSSLTGPGVVVASLLRPEGFLLFVFIAVYEFLEGKRWNGFLTRLVAVYILVLLPYLVFKYIYFGTILPNPFFAKTGLNIAKLYDGLEYAGRFYYHYLIAGLLLIPTLILFLKKKLEINILLYFCLIYTVYIIMVGGDVLKVHRFFIPILPFLFLLIVYGLDRLIRNRIYIIPIFLGAVIWQYFIPDSYIKSYYQAEKRIVEKMTTMADNIKSIDNSDFSIAASTIGALGYNLMGHTLIDMLGLTDSTIARHPQEPIEGISTTWKERNYNTPYLLSRQPDYILFSTGGKPSAPAEKSLFLYSKFFKCYRTIPFRIWGIRTNLFKRYFPVSGEIRRDIDFHFVNDYYESIQAAKDGQLEQALLAAKRAEEVAGKNIYTLAGYQQSEILRLMKRYEESYNLLNELFAKDTLTYEVIKDLFTFERLAYKNLGRADSLYARLEKICPWYLPYLDSMVTRYGGKP